MANILVGADPEFFVMRGDQFISAHELPITGTKEEPQPLDRGDVQVDGTALEIGMTPCSTAEEFADTLEYVLEQVRALIGPEYNIAPTSQSTFNEDYFRRIPIANRRLGCQPDFNAFEGCINKPPHLTRTPKRYAGGHVHVSVENRDTQELVEKLIPFLDARLAPMCNKLDPTTERRFTYGRLSNYRPKPYGIEYRTPSAMWFLGGRQTRMDVFNIVKECVDRAFDFGEVVSREEWGRLHSSQNLEEAA